MKIVIADDHRLIIEGVRAALASSPDIEIVGEATTGGEVLPLVTKLRPDVVLLDIRLPQVDGFSVLELLRQRAPEVKVVILSILSEPEYIQAALKRGASGYVVKTIDPRDLAAALRQVVHGTVFHTVGVGAEDDDRAVREAGLTDREITILRAVARGLSNKAIARELEVTEQTVKFHLTNIYRKLDVANRTEAARSAFRLGLDQVPPLTVTLLAAIVAWLTAWL
jgi:DNA-binding NarL/FixJ family response regulator